MMPPEGATYITVHVLGMLVYAFGLGSDFYSSGSLLSLYLFGSLRESSGVSEIFWEI